MESAGFVVIAALAAAILLSAVLLPLSVSLYQKSNELAEKLDEQEESYRRQLLDLESKLDEKNAQLASAASSSVPHDRVVYVEPRLPEIRGKKTFYFLTPDQQKAVTASADNYPKSKGDGKYGEVFTFSVSKSGKHYHKCTCQYMNKNLIVNAWGLARPEYAKCTPCTICAPVLPDTSFWKPKPKRS